MGFDPFGVCAVEGRAGGLHANPPGFGLPVGGGGGGLGGGGGFGRLLDKNADHHVLAIVACQADLLADAAATLLPDGSLDVVCYACTSGSLVIGEQRVMAELNRGQPQVRATSLITGVMRALRQVGARKIVVGTPYLDEVNQREADYMTAAGFDILAIEGLNLEKDSDMVRVTPAFIHDFAISLDRPDADAVFISCGALRTLDVIGDIETAIGKPAICSNQAMIWDTLRLAGIDDRFEGYGRLLADH